MKEQLDLINFPVGIRYEDTYGQWLELFKKLAESDTKFSIRGCPRSWASLIYALGNDIESVRDHFPTDSLARCTPELLKHFEREGLLREMVECHSTLRPELVDSLYKADMEWITLWRLFKENKGKEEMILVTNNASFFRLPFMNYLDNILPTYIPTKTKCVIVPCAADKPYPAPLHKVVRENITDDYEIIIATGVLGLVPELLWPQMPLYDSGMPNQWRCMLAVEKFFGLNGYNRVVVYSDFYASAIHRGLKGVRYQDGHHNVAYVFGYAENMPYQDLLSSENLNTLRSML
jgi:hypothetical protein